MSRLRALAVNALLALVSTALVLAALELMARSWRARDREPIAARYTEFDPLLGWRHTPGAAADFPLGAYRINSRGLRDVERGYTAAPGVQRVLVLGDSFAEGYNVPFEDCIAQVLERRLAAPSCPVEAINGGTVAYSTDQEYLFYREELWRYEARTVVLFLYYNDVLYNGRASLGARPKPLFSFTGGQARLKNVPLTPEAGAPAPGAAAREVERGSAALEWLSVRLMNANPAVHDVFARLGLWEPIEADEAPLELQIYSRNPPQAVSDAWEFTRHILRHLNAEVASHKARLVVAYVPSKMEVSERAWALTRARFGVDETTWDRGRLARLLRRAGADFGFPVLDLTDALRDAERSGRGGPYYDPGGHWNALGDRIAAEQVERFLREQAWLSCPGP